MCYFSQCHRGNMSLKILLRDTINRPVLKIIVCSVQEDGFVTSKELLFQKYVRRAHIVLLEQAVNTQRFHVHQAHILIKRVSGRRVSAVHVLLENIVVLVQLLHKHVKQVITVRTMRPMINSMMNSAMVPVHLDFIVNQEQLIRNHVHLEHTVLKLGSQIEVRRDVQIVRKGSFAPSGLWDRRYKLIHHHFLEILFLILDSNVKMGSHVRLGNEQQKIPKIICVQVESIVTKNNLFRVKMDVINRLQVNQNAPHVRPAISVALLSVEFQIMKNVQRVHFVLMVHLRRLNVHLDPILTTLAPVVMAAMTTVSNVHQRNIVKMVKLKVTVMLVIFVIKVHPQDDLVLVMLVPVNPVHVVSFVKKVQQVSMHVQKDNLSKWIRIPHPTELEQAMIQTVTHVSQANSALLMLSRSKTVMLEDFVKKDYTFHVRKENIMMSLVLKTNPPVNHVNQDGTVQTRTCPSLNNIRRILVIISTLKTNSI